jgi:hypothetical protein
MYGKLNTANRRRFARVPLETFFTGYTGAGDGLLLRSYDVGRGGLKVASVTPVEPGAFIRLDFGGGVEAPGRTAWSAPQPGRHGFRTGIRTLFDDVESVDLMGQLMFAGLVQSGALPLREEQAVTLLTEGPEPAPSIAGAARDETVRS